MNELLALLAFLGGLAIVVGVPVGVGIWVLRPVDRAARRTDGPTQFTIADFLCLFFLIQMPMSFNHWALRSDEAPVWGIDVYIWCAAGLMWWYGVRNLTRAGVNRSWYRIVFLAAVLPFALFGSFVLAVLAVMFTVGAFSGGPAEVGVWGAVIGVALLVGIYACGRFTRWLIAQADRAASPESLPPEKAT